ncbi:MAG: PQQ-binding-like beta-propeller repeat protein [Syntrophomonadaceae bacterium]|nr:PQQ-binding-like beta-propeller repeat protein [Syntrophomonadaceae bacterium]MDD3022867.1 PQQ-binding-like beta-propeller repeat protein [Syntrophomonadaceae bacterium]
MQRIMLALLIVLALAIPAHSANQLEIYNTGKEASKAGQIIWKLYGVGKVTEDIVIAPNGNLLLSMGSKLVCINPQGKMLWEAKGAGGTMGKPLPVPSGAIYTAGGSAVQEIKINGVSGWNYSIYAGTKGAKKEMLAGGAENIIYLPLPDALYAVDTSGHHAWILSPWESSEGNSTKVNNPKTFLTCIADKQACYVVYGEKKGYKLAAIDKQGKYLWSYWFGDITRAYLSFDNSGRLIASVSFKKGTAGNDSSKLNTCKLYCFQPTDGKTALWTSSFKISNELSSLYIAADNSIYVSGGSKLYAIEGSTGKRLWEDPLLKLVSPPVANPANGRIYAGSSDGVLYAVNKSGRMIWSRQLDGAVEMAPVISSDQYIYVITKKGNLYKIIDKYN